MKNANRRLLHGIVGAVLGAFIGFAIAAFVLPEVGDGAWKPVAVAAAVCFVLGFLLGKHALDWLKEIAEQSPH